MPDYDVWFVESGRGKLRYGGAEILLEPGVCFVWRPGDAPSLVRDEHDRLVVFACHFQPLGAKGETLDGPPIPYPMRVRDFKFFAVSAHRAERLWLRDTSESRAAARRILLEMLWQLADEVAHPQSPEDPVMRELAGNILSRLGDPWNVDAMAEYCHLSRSQLTRRFLAVHGTSPVRFVIQARIERARQLLLESDSTLDSIARALGYSDVFFFARQFKQVTGLPPGSLRRR